MKMKNNKKTTPLRSFRMTRVRGESEDSLGTQSKTMSNNNNPCNDLQDENDKIKCLFCSQRQNQNLPVCQDLNNKEGRKKIIEILLGDLSIADSYIAGKLDSVLYENPSNNLYKNLHYNEWWYLDDHNDNYDYFLLRGISFESKNVKYSEYATIPGDFSRIINRKAHLKTCTILYNYDLQCFIMKHVPVDNQWNSTFFFKNPNKIQGQIQEPATNGIYANSFSGIITFNPLGYECLYADLKILIEKYSFNQVYEILFNITHKKYQDIV
jgi:hypothetical protein